MSSFDRSIALAATIKGAALADPGLAGERAFLGQIGLAYLQEVPAPRTVRLRRCRGAWGPDTSSDKLRQCARTVQCVRTLRRDLAASKLGGRRYRLSAVSTDPIDLHVALQLMLMLEGAPFEPEGRLPMSGYDTAANFFRRVRTSARS
jgi:hypothetical protein